MEFDKRETLFVSDLDGTLLGSDSRLSATAVAMLNQLIAQGVQFTVATARTPATVVPLLHELHLRLPLITLNGAALWNPVKGDYAQVHTLSAATVEQIAATFERNGLRPFIYRRHGHVIHACHSGALSAQEQQFVAERQGLDLKQFFLNDDDYVHSADPAMLVFSMQDYERLRPVYEQVKAEIACSPVFYHDIFDPTSGLLEIYAPGVSKAAALRQVAAMAGASQVVAFGDNRNDLPMLRAATHSVAVANAFPEVQAAAHEVTGANTDDAVPRYIAAHTAG